MDLGTRPGHLRERPGLHEPGRVRGGQEHRARGRRHLPHPRTASSRPARSPPALELLRLLRHPGGGRPDHRQQRRLQGEGGPRLLHSRTSSIPSRRTSAPRASSSRTSGSSAAAGCNIGGGLLLGHGPQLRPDLLRRPLLPVRLGLRPRVPLPRCGRRRAATSAPTSSAAPSSRTAAGSTTSTGTRCRCCPARCGPACACRRRARIDFQRAVPGRPGPRPPAATAPRRASLQRGFGPLNVQLWPTPPTPSSRATTASTAGATCPPLEIDHSRRASLAHRPRVRVEPRAENLAFGNQDRVDTYGRYDLYPRAVAPASPDLPAGHAGGAASAPRGTA